MRKGSKKKLLVIIIPSDFSGKFRQPHHLAGISKLIVVPGIQRYVFAVVRNNGGRRIQDRSMRRANCHSGNKFSGGGIMYLLDQLTVKGSIFQRFVYSFYTG